MAPEIQNNLPHSNSFGQFSEFINFVNSRKVYIKILKHIYIFFKSKWDYFFNY